MSMARNATFLYKPGLVLCLFIMGQSCARRPT